MAEVITMVKTVSQVQFLGVHGQQLAATQGLEFKETPKGISVTSKHHTGKRYVVYNANIAHVEYKEVPE
jgi:hypothetical protein